MRILLNLFVALLLGVETEASVAIVQAFTKELSKTSLLLEMSYWYAEVSVCLTR